LKTILYQSIYLAIDLLRVKDFALSSRKWPDKFFDRPFKEEKIGYDYIFKIRLYS
jgi:hypothetical protein